MVVAGALSAPDIEPITVRITVMKLMGKLCDNDGDIREDFRIMRPFPTGRKYTKLWDSTFTLKPGEHRSIKNTISLNQWLTRKAGIRETGIDEAMETGTGMNPILGAHTGALHRRNDPRYLGGDVKNLIMADPDQPNSFNRRIEPFAEWGPDRLAHPDLDPSSYNSDTSRIIMLVQTTDDTIGGLFGPLTAGTGWENTAINARGGLDATQPTSRMNNASQIACAGYMTAVCYDEK